MSLHRQRPTQQGEGMANTTHGRVWQTQQNNGRVYIIMANSKTGYGKPSKWQTQQMAGYGNSNRGQGMANSGIWQTQQMTRYRKLQMAGYGNSNRGQGMANPKQICTSHKWQGYGKPKTNMHLPQRLGNGKPKTNVHLPQRLGYGKPKTICTSPQHNYSKQKATVYHIMNCSCTHRSCLAGINTPL